MSKNKFATIFYGFLLLCLIVFISACGSYTKTVTVDSNRCYSVEIVNNIGEHILVPISDIETMEYLGSGWFIWKKDNTGWWDVQIVGYGKIEGCE